MNHYTHNWKLLWPIFCNSRAAPFRFHSIEPSLSSSFRFCDSVLKPTTKDREDSNREALGLFPKRTSHPALLTWPSNTTQYSINQSSSLFRRALATPAHLSLGTLPTLTWAPNFVPPLPRAVSSNSSTATSRSLQTKDHQQTGLPLSQPIYEFPRRKGN